MIEHGTSRSPWSLAIETSGRVGSVSVARGATIVATRSFSAHLRHAVELLPTVDELCKGAEIAAADVGIIHVSAGPGSFTGLRIGVTFAKSLAYATGAAVVRVPTLEVIAQNALDQDAPPPRVAALLDAKRNNVFAATFCLRDGRYVAEDDPQEHQPGSYLGARAPIAVVGEGVEVHRHVLEQVSGLTVPASIEHAARADVVHRIGHRMALAGEFTSLDAVLPIYIRRPDAEERWEARTRQIDQA